jgi:hypothetical protein
MLLICCWLNLNLLSSICIFLIAKVLSFIKSLDGACGVLQQPRNFGGFFLYIIIPDSSLLFQEDDGIWSFGLLLLRIFFGSSVLE